MDNVIKIVKSFEGSGLLIKGKSETIKNKSKEQNGRFVGILLVTLGASILGNILTEKGVKRAGEKTIRARQDFYCRLTF